MISDRNGREIKQGSKLAFARDVLPHVMQGEVIEMSRIIDAPKGPKDPGHIRIKIALEVLEIPAPFHATAPDLIVLEDAAPKEKIVELHPN